MDAENPISVSGVNHSFGRGDLRTPVLTDVNLEIRSGEIVILTGPSGSGKTTLLTLIGALRTTQQGSVRVLGEELCAASQKRMLRVRRRIGYVFQHHNLLSSLTASQNVQMALDLHPQSSRRRVRERADEALKAVGLADLTAKSPKLLSGGQRQRVAIARALAAEPQIILADEPTASLDKNSGRDVVDLIRTLAKEQGVTVLLVTHDNRILDVADRIVHLEEGRVSSFVEAVTAHTEKLMSILTQSSRKGELQREVEEMQPDEFSRLLRAVTYSAQQFLEGIQLSRDEAFESMLAQAVNAFTIKLAEVLGTERASLFMVDRERKELWLHAAQPEDGKPLEVRLPIGQDSIAGHVAISGEALRVDDAQTHPLWHGEVDRGSGFRTRNILCLPVLNSDREVFAVAQLLNKSDGRDFDAGDEVQFKDFIADIGVILESWWQMRRRNENREAEQQ